jgi:hypothetical protein
MQPAAGLKIQEYSAAGKVRENETRKGKADGRRGIQE